MTIFVLPLDSPETTLAMAGGKGANLSRMTCAGFPVPPGFLISTIAYGGFVDIFKHLNLCIIYLDLLRLHTEERLLDLFCWLNCSAGGA